MTRDLSTAGVIVRSVFAEVVALRLLRERTSAVSAHDAAALLDEIVAELKSGVGEIVAALRQTNKVEALKIAARVPDDLTTLLGEIEALKPST